MSAHKKRKQVLINTNKEIAQIKRFLKRTNGKGATLCQGPCEEYEENFQQLYKIRRRKKKRLKKLLQKVEKLLLKHPELVDSDYDSESFGSSST